MKPERSVADPAGSLAGLGELQLVVRVFTARVAGVCSFALRPWALHSLAKFRRRTSSAKIVGERRRQCFAGTLS